MRVIRDLDELVAPVETVVTIGNFDGVHVAHQALLRAVVEQARSLRATAAAITFDPHPMRLLAPERAPQLLTPLEKKAQLIAQSGAELLVVLPFTRQLSERSPEEFVTQVLRGRLHALSVHVGPNFRFGHGQRGDVQLLEKLARSEGFELHVLPAVVIRGQPVSSTRIRQLLSLGQVHKAARLLGRPFSVGGEVVAGSGLGRAKTVPTLNLAPVDQQLPRNGVYVTYTRIAEARHPSVTNVGYKPTFGDHPLTVESFLLDVTDDACAETMEIEFLFRLRDEKKFPDAAALKAQIMQDVRRTRRYFHLCELLSAAGSRQEGGKVRAC